jgi:hypothetical protein
VLDDYEVRTCLGPVALLCAVAVLGCGDHEAASLRAYTIDRSLADEYADIRSEATTLAGEPADIPLRAIFLHETYVDSGRNYVFPEVALHGALWADGFFHDVSWIELLLTSLVGDGFEPLSQAMVVAERFADRLQAANQQVFVDTYTNYFFSKRFGTRDGASAFLQPDLLDALNRMHAANASGEPLSRAERGDLFALALAWEQENTVAELVTEAVAEIDDELLKAVMLRPVVRYEYFPAFKFFFFRDFSDKAERTERATQAYETAENRGWSQVADSMQRYGSLPQAYFADRSSFAAALKAELLADSSP